MRRIAVLGSGAQPTPADLLYFDAHLRELGCVEGQNLLVERRYANGRAELLRPFAEELLPTAQRVGVLENSTNPIFGVKRKENEPLYRSLGMQTIIVEVAAASELENAVAEMARQRAQALVLAADSLFRVNRVLIMSAALKHALPTIVEGADMLEAGGLLSYTFSVAELDYRRVAFIDKILRGAKPADLPIEQPTKFKLGINLKIAKALGINVPKTLLLRADEVIQ